MAFPPDENFYPWNSGSLFPDAPQDKPWVHWILFNISPTRNGLAEAVDVSTLDEVKSGYNDFKRTSWGGPCPPPGHGRHTYHFKLYALDITLPLKSGTTKEDVEKAMHGHVLQSTELLGFYERHGEK